MPAPAMAEEVVELARALAHGKRRVRHRALEDTEKWLRRNDSIDRDDLLRLWKGLFYSLWHEDKWETQASELSKFLHCHCTPLPKIAS